MVKSLLHTFQFQVVKLQNVEQFQRGEYLCKGTVKSGFQMFCTQVELHKYT